MSSIARWSYKSEATIRPLVKGAEWDSPAEYGPEYKIACTWTAQAEQHRSSEGAEFVSRHIIFTEDERPKRLDLIAFAESDGWEEIRDRTAWDMAMFGDTPDYKLVT